MIKFINIRIKTTTDDDEEDEESNKEKSPNDKNLHNDSFEKKKKKELILPKLNSQILDPHIIPERIDIYKKVKIRDIIGISEIVKPPFKIK